MNLHFETNLGLGRCEPPIMRKGMLSGLKEAPRRELIIATQFRAVFRIGQDLNEIGRRLQCLYRPWFLGQIRSSILKRPVPSSRARAFDSVAAYSSRAFRRPTRTKVTKWQADCGAACR